MIHKIPPLPQAELERYLDFITPIGEDIDLAIYLESAIATGNVVEVLHAINNGADLEDMDGESPLKYAMDCGCPKIIKILTEAGAKLSTVENLEIIRKTDPKLFLRELDIDNYERIYKKSRR